MAARKEQIRSQGENPNSIDRVRSGSQFGKVYRLQPRTVIYRSNWYLQVHHGTSLQLSCC